MNLSVFSKDPDERLDYDIDFSRWLPDGDVIMSVVTSISGGTAIIDGTEPSDTCVRVWVAGGAVGETNTITIRATTAQGRIKEAALRLKIKETI